MAPATAISKKLRYTCAHGEKDKHGHTEAQERRATLGIGAAGCRQLSVLLEYAGVCVRAGRAICSVFTVVCCVCGCV